MTTYTDDLATVLADLGVEVKRVSGDEIQGRCPVHHLTKGRESSRFSWYMNSESGLWHCLGGDTMVITPYGRRSISDLAKSGTAWVLDGNGSWQQVQVQSFGTQRLHSVTLSRNGIQRSIKATAHHRWVTRYGERTTSQLLPDMRIPSVFHTPVAPESVVREAIQAGFTFGDGHRLSANGVPYACRAEFFNEHDLEVASYFDAPVKRSKDHWRIDPLPVSYKDLPRSCLPHTTWLYWWVAGYFAADGSCTKGANTPTMSSASKEHLEFVYDSCVALGIRTSEVRETTRVGYCGRSALYQLSFYGGLTPEFFLRTDQREAFLGMDKKFERTGWTVKGVVDTGLDEEVFCAVVPSTSSFVLDGNVLTGNCFTCGGRGNLPILVSQLTGNTDSILAVQQVLIRNGLKRLTSPNEQEPEVEVDWIRYSQFAPLPERILEHRSLDADTAHRYGVRWGDVVIRKDPVTETKMIITPIVSPMGELRGWQGKKTGMVMNVPESVHKSHTLFGIERAVHKRAILMESPLDVVRFAHACADTDISPLASFGASVSDEQIKIITTRFDQLTMAMDNDNAGKNESRRLAKLWPSFRQGVRYLDYTNAPDCKDIGDMTDEQIKEIPFSTTRLCP